MRVLLVIVLLALLVSVVATTSAADPIDSDGDGITDGSDNCPAIANADQANSWGGDSGDACELPRYDTTDFQMAAFPQANGIALWGDCVDGVCREVGVIDPLLLTADEALRVGDATNNGWYAVINFLEVNDEAASVYQVNLYHNGVLLDAGLQIHINDDGSWSMTPRDGESMYIGNIPEEA